MRTPVLLVIACTALSAPNASAQAVPRVSAGWGVDTAAAAWSELAWHGAVAAIFRAWHDYLRSDAALQAPTPLWSAEEQARWPMYDLTAGIAYRGAPATVLDIRPADAADTYVIRTLFASATGESREVRPIALTRVYAVRENGRWVFSNALPRHTSEWSRSRVGNVAYVVEPGLPFDRDRAARSLMFADSLAGELGVPAIEDLVVYVARSPESLHRAMGVDWTFGGLGHGYAIAANRMVLSGDAQFAEDNRHELVHILLAPLLEERRTHGLVSEGLATWLGGSSGRDYHVLLPEYAAFLRAHRDVTLAGILTGEGPDRGWNPAGAVLVHMVHDHGGTAALLELLRGGRSTVELQQTVSRLLGRSWEDVQAAWRMRVLEGPQPRQSRSTR